jgi:hypothetical protein
VISLRIDRGAPPGWDLELRGRWTPAAGDALLAAVTGILRGPDRADPATGTITFWPRRVLGSIVGPRRIALDVTFGRGRVVLDGEVGPPPYLTGITLPGRLTAGSGEGSPEEEAAEEDVKVWIHPAQLLELWFRINL